MKAPIYELGNFTKIHTGKLDANASNENGKFPFFTCAQEPFKIDTYSYDCECVLVAGNGDLNVKHYHGKFDAYQRTYIIEKLPEFNNTIHLRYVYHFLETYLDKLREQSIGGIIKYIKLGSLTSAKIPLPSLLEQKRIAGILDSADALRIKRRESLSLLDNLIQSTFLDMFGDPVTNPMGWEDSYKLSELSEIASGITKGRKLKNKKLYEVPYLAVANVQDRHLNIDNIKTILATKEEIERYRLLSNDLLLTEGGDPDKVGRGALWNGELPECIHQNHIFRVRLKSDALNPVFLNWLIGSRRGKSYFLRSAKQTTGIASINMTQLRAFPLLIPPINLQHHFATIVESIEKQKVRLQAHLSELDTLFASLQQRAFNGEL